MNRAILFALLACPLIGCQQADVPIAQQQNKPNPDPAVKYYKGPADGKKVAIHLQNGFKGEHVTLHYNSVRLWDGDPKTSMTLGKAAVVNFTIGKEGTGKIGFQQEGQLIEKSFAWEKGAYIAIRISPGEKREVTWQQQEKEFVYD
jgi:hypothetical protein